MVGRISHDPLLPWEMFCVFGKGTGEGIKVARLAVGASSPPAGDQRAGEDLADE